MVEYQSPSHTRWDCMHVVFIPKRPGVRMVPSNGYWLFQCLGTSAFGSAREHLTLLNRRGTDPYAR
jgi:hypothetical protein